jgi:hypothetical protein
MTLLLPGLRNLRQNEKQYRSDIQPMTIKIFADETCIILT